MRFDQDTLTEILDTLTRNRSRSFMTAFGVFWGILMLVILSGGSNGLEKMLWAQFDGFATNSGFTFSSTTSMPFKGFNKGRYWNIEQKDVEAIKKRVTSVEVITGKNSEWSKTATYRELKYDDCTLQGLEACYTSIEAQEMLYGRFLNDVDIIGSRKVCVLGKKPYETLFRKGQDPCGEMINVDGIQYKVIGVTSSESNININGSMSESITIPITTLQKTYNKGQVIEVLCYTAKEGHKVSECDEEIASVLKGLHYIHPDDKQAVSSFNVEEMFQMVENVFLGLGILTWLVGLGTLLAGVIGVSNIMMVTVKERTSEIGIRRAIGAKPFDILFQIIAECLLLTSIAGMMGLSTGVGILSLTDQLVKTDAGSNFGFGISLSVGIGITIILVILGVIASLAPALRAMAIKPIEAMREE